MIPERSVRAQIAVSSIGQKPHTHLPIRFISVINPGVARLRPQPLPLREMNPHHQTVSAPEPHTTGASVGHPFVAYARFYPNGAYVRVTPAPGSPFAACVRSERLARRSA